MKKLTKKQQQHFAALLVAEADALTGSVERLAQQDSQWAMFSVSDQRSRDPLEGDMVTVERAVLNELAASNASGAQQVSRALEKLNDGTYGQCDECGGEIGLERLEVRPRATRCVKCS